jgi:hypothetical protein
METLSKRMMAFFGKHKLSLDSKDHKARVELWLSDLSHDVQDALVLILEREYVHFKVAAKKGGYTICSEIFPKYKEGYFPLAALINEALVNLGKPTIIYEQHDTLQKALQNAAPIKSSHVPNVVAPKTRAEHVALRSQVGFRLDWSAYMPLLSLILQMMTLNT